ncbi:MAG: toxin-antitoxin system YwqK family antitoxin [Candidatus Pacearchaeota archaeon]
MDKTKKRHIGYHKDGSIWFKGFMKKGVMEGYWEWYRKDGIIMRSGYFENGKQTGIWTTYDKSGKVVRVTTIKKK